MGVLSVLGRRAPRWLKRAVAAARQPGDDVHPIITEWPSDLSYDQADLNAWKAARFENFVEDRLYESVPSGGAALLCLLAAAAPRPISVVDFGGSFGDIGLTALHHTNGKIGSYTIVEGAGVARLGAQKTIPYRIAFSTEIPSSSFDVFFTSGTLQYLEDWVGVVSTALERTTTHALFCRNSFGSYPLMRLQRSRIVDHGRGSIPHAGNPEAEVLSPHRTVSKVELVALAYEKRFDLAYEFESTSGVLPRGGLVTGGDLVFRRR